MQYWNAVLKLAITGDMGLAIKKNENKPDNCFEHF